MEMSSLQSLSETKPPFVNPGRMKQFQLSPEAASEVREIWSCIAADSVATARRVLLNLFDPCQRLSDNPGIGHVREDLTDQAVLFWPVGSHLIIYNPKSSPLADANVLHGARDVPSLF